MSTALQLLGAALFVAGVGAIFWPAALIVAGLVLFGVGFLSESPGS